MLKIFILRENCAIFEGKISLCLIVLESIRFKVKIFMLIVYKKYQGLKTIWIHANIIFTSFNKLYEKLSFVEFLKVKIYNK